MRSIKDALIARLTSLTIPRWAYVSVAAILLVGLVVTAAVYRQGIVDLLAETTAAEDAALDHYENVALEAERAVVAAGEAAESAEEAAASVTALEAAEAAAAAAKAAAEALRAANIAKGLTAEGKCPSGSTARSTDANGIDSGCTWPKKAPLVKKCYSFEGSDKCDVWVLVPGREHTS